MQFVAREIFELFNLNGSQVFARVLNTGLPITTSLKLRKIYRMLKAEYEDIEQTRISLIEKYGVQNETGNTVVLPENEFKFRTELDEAWAFEIEVDIKEPVVVNVKYIPGLMVSVAEQELLEKIIIFEEDEE